jgi:hypothetical protein
MVDAWARKNRRHDVSVSRLGPEHWQDKKLEAYSGFLQIIDSWMYVVTALATDVVTELSPPANGDDIRANLDEPVPEVFATLRKSLEDSMDRVHRTYATLRIVAPDSWFEIATDAYVKYLKPIE